MGETNKTADARNNALAGCDGPYEYGLPYGFSSEGKESAREAAQECADYQTKTTGDRYIAVESSCNISDGLPARVPVGCFRVLNTVSLWERIKRFLQGK